MSLQFREWMAVSNSLHKSREVMYVAFPSSITAVTPQNDVELEISYAISSTLPSLTRHKQKVLGEKSVRGQEPGFISP